MAVSVIALIISGITFIFAIYQFAYKRKREKLESTLIAYGEIQIRCLTNLNSILEEVKKKGLTPEDIYKNPVNENIRIKIDIYLPVVERFAVGVNIGLYSTDILKRCGSSYLIYTYNNAKDIIAYKKNPENEKVRGRHYDEFETLINTLKAESQN